MSAAGQRLRALAKQLLAAAPTEASGGYTIYYFFKCEKFWGRAIGILATLDHAGQKYELKDIKEAPPGVGMGWPQIVLPSGQAMAQTPAILDLLGEATGLSGKTPEEKVSCKQALMDVQDIFSETTGGKFADKPERVDKFFGLLEARLQKTKFLVRDEPTIADFHGVFAFEWVHKLIKGGIDAGKFPKLAAWWTSIAEVPAVKKMKTSGIQMIP